MYYQLPNKLDWYKDIVAEAERKGISLRTVCDVAGISYESIKHAAIKLAKNGTGISYESLVSMTDVLNSMDGTRE